MALPSAVTVASLTVVVAAGVGLAAAAATTYDEPAADHSSSPTANSRTHHLPKAKPTPTRHSHHAPARHKHRHRDTGSTPRIPTVPVGVYNNSGITGLAAEHAATLEAAGWKVATTDNWYGDIAANTVYFPSGMRSDAKRLATVLHIDRLRPAVAPMQFDLLTVIFTSS